MGIEFLLRRLQAPLALFSLGSPWVAEMPSGSVNNETCSFNSILEATRLSMGQDRVSAGIV